MDVCALRAFGGLAFGARRPGRDTPDLVAIKRGLHAHHQDVLDRGHAVGGIGHAQSCSVRAYRRSELHYDAPLCSYQIANACTASAVL